MRPLSLITCTADRPLCFPLYERWLKRMLENYDGEVQLIVVDGGQEKITPTLGQEYYPTPYQATPLQSFWNNMAEGFKHVKFDTVGFIEDDDYYKADFLNLTVALFDRRFKANIVGEGNAKYWHVPCRGWVNNKNKHHASLCQTMITGPMLKEMETVIALRESPYLDMIIWRKPTARRIVGENLIPWCVGMKAMPGRTGFVPGHQAAWYKSVDHTGDILRSWIGEDAEIYLDMSSEESKIPKKETGTMDTNLQRRVSRLNTSGFKQR